MANSKDQSPSRRKWLGLAAGASLGSGLLARAKTARAEPKPPASHSGARTYNIRDFGATGDGKTLDTTAVQAAIDACAKENHNNDGFHFISAQHVQLSNCTVQCQDDACALFGSCKFVFLSPIW